MLFQKDKLAFQIFDVLYLRQGYSKTRNKNRHYDALSFRIRSNTVIIDNELQINLQDNSIAYFPANHEYTRIAELDDLIVVHFKCYDFSGRCIEHFLPTNPEEYNEMFHQLLSSWQAKEPGYQYHSAAIFNRILERIHCDNLPVSLTHSKIDPSIQYIQQNLYQTDLSLATAAQKSFVSDVYFRKLFKEHFGISPKQFVIQRRIQQAASLILAGYCSLHEVAEMCGYPDYKHFTTEFKRIMGVSPSQYEYNHISEHKEV